ncbi:MAG: DUF2062 domain-containing protein [Deltaproteobacteria bacterium]|nr:DUF2062 domain-containing protein [Deltaproteobacteria bacterium]
MNDSQGKRETGILERYRTLTNKIYNNVIQPLVTSRNAPHYDALGVSLGLIIGFGAPLGSHMLVLGLLRLVLKFNFIVAFGFTFVGNPLNVIPMYYGYYLLGSFVLGESASLSFENFQTAINPVVESNYFWESMLTFFKVGRTTLIRWITAAVLLATVFGILGYVVTYAIQRKRLLRSALNLDVEYRDLITKLRSKDSKSDLRDRGA